MIPDFLQLSAGPLDLRYQVDELAGVSLIWTQVQGRTRWRDDMTEGSLHLGFVIQSMGPIVVRGRPIDNSDVQVWIPGKEMDDIVRGPLLALEIGVESDIVEALGWRVEGEPLQSVPWKALNRLTEACRRASTAIGRSGDSTR